MQASFYLIIQGKKHHIPRLAREGHKQTGTIEVRKNKPNTRQDEIAVKMDLEIPDSLFEKPTLHVGASIPEDGGYGPEIPAEVQQNIAEVVRERTGLTVHISAAEAEEED